MPKIITHNAQETKNLGLSLGRNCRGGECFALCGDLGSGKTKLAQGLALGLGIKTKVTSPTFNILKVYRVPKRHSVAQQKIEVFCHIDAYRLTSAADLEALGVSEFFNNPRAVVAVEWAEKVKRLWPRRAKVLKFKSLPEFSREIVIK